ncbi:hypothetical protein MNO11_22605 [Serratia plymuthica]|uniref:hypothetical protein n=1 Tax=Serratia plymuthica TaxID=82996 RepID=UPI001F5331AE|nr:hypothetical protein [Serratia plymuthica]UNK27553.1 hypothetical protein MNO11_22605 [Serratia plymuthica]
MTLKIEVKAMLGLTIASRAVIQSSLCDLTAENTAEQPLLPKGASKQAKNTEKQKAQPCRNAVHLSGEA